MSKGLLRTQALRRTMIGCLAGGWFMLSCGIGAAGPFSGWFGFGSRETSPTATPVSTGKLPVVPPPTGNGVFWRLVPDETSVTQVMSDLESWHIDQLYLETFASGKVIYAGGVMPSKFDDGRDWLGEACRVAREHHIAVHAWINTLSWYEPRSDDEFSTPDLLARHPDWVDEPAPGSKRPDQDREIFVSPFQPDVRRHLLSITDEILSRPVSFVTLGCLQYDANVDSGYNPSAMKDFESRTGIEPRSLAPGSRSGDDWMKWVEFREDQLTSVVQLLAGRVRDDTGGRDRPVLVEAAFTPGYEASRGRNSRYQNWPEWVREGYVDIAVPLCFEGSLVGLEKELREARSLTQEAQMPCVPMLAIDSINRNHPPLDEQEQVLHGVGFKFASVFPYEVLKRLKTEKEKKEKPEKD